MTRLSKESRLDELDRRLLRELQRNCKVTISELAQRVGKPRTTISARLVKLREAGVIKGYRAMVDPKSLGFKFSAFVFITARRGGSGSNQVALAKKIIEECSESGDLWIEEVDIVTGRYDLVLKVRVKSLEKLTSLLITYLPKIRDVEHTETFLVLQTIDELRPAPI